MNHLDQAVRSNLDLLFSMFPGIRDGNPDAIHDARVATRRLRAAVPLAWAFRPEEQWIDQANTIRTLGRALGRARDVDVSLDGLGNLESRVPAAAAPLVALRQGLRDRQWSERRRLIKSIESMPLESLAELCSGRRRPSVFSDPRRQAVTDSVVERATKLGEAVARASGVYFPKRAHQVRVEAKKLRYLLELVPRTARPPRALKRLRCAQQLLGRLHDRQSLIEMIDEARVASREPERYDPLLASLSADSQDLYREYLGVRDSVARLVDDLIRGNAADRGHAAAAGLLLAGAAAASSVAFFLAGRPRRRGVPSIEPRKAEDGRTAHRPKEVAADRREHVSLAAAAPR
jgi:CHAD domain-containing protein